MKKVYVFYIATISSLFLALFAVFSLAGLGTEFIAFEDRIPTLDPEPAPKAEPISFARGIDYPDLRTHQMYSVSHATQLFSDPEGLFDRREELPPGGFFLIESKEEQGVDLWYRVTVNSGGLDYSMYLKAQDLNWKDVQPVPSAESRAAMSQEEKLARMAEAFGVDLRAKRPTPEPEPEPEPPAASRMAAAMRDAIRNVSSHGIASAALAAGVTTTGIVLVISLLVWLRGTRRWDKSTLYEEIGAQRGEEFYEDTASNDAKTDEF